MAGEFSKQDGALNRGAQMVASARGDLSQQLSALRGKLSGIGAQWQGSGSSAFQSVMAQWDADSAKIVSALDQFEQNLRTSESTYNSADDTQSQSFNKFSARLG